MKLYRRRSRSKFARKVIHQATSEFPEIMGIVAGGELNFFVWLHEMGKGLSRDSTKNQTDIKQ